MAMPTPEGITPPAPGLDHEEPDVLMVEDDIPREEEGWRWATAEMDKIHQ